MAIDKEEIALRYANQINYHYTTSENSSACRFTYELLEYLIDEVEGRFKSPEDQLSSLIDQYTAHGELGKDDFI